MSFDTELGRALGKKRAAVLHLIRYEMKLRLYNQRRVARELGLSEAMVSKTVNGIKHSPRVLNKLRAIGVPEEYLFDPRRAAGDNAGRKA